MLTTLRWRQLDFRDGLEKLPPRYFVFGVVRSECNPESAIMRKPDKSSVNQKKAKDCSRCSRENGEVFRCYRQKFEFDVDQARQIVADGRLPLELDADDIAYSIDHCEINEAHISHVDSSIPGIVSHVFFPDADGNVHHAHRLIDGHHRAARCLRDGYPFRVFILTEAESVRILSRAPEGARPAHLVEAVSLT